MKKGYKSNKKKIKKQKLEHNKKVLWYFLISFALVCFLVASFFAYNTYSLWSPTYSQNDVNKIIAGCFELEVNDLDVNSASTAIKLENTYPMTEDKGLLTSPYLLTIKNTCNIPSEYTVILNKFNNSNLQNDFIRYQMKNGDNVSTQLLSNANKYVLDASLKNDLETERGLSINESFNLATGSLNENETVSYELRIWVDYNATNDTMNKSFEANVTVLSTSPQ